MDENMIVERGVSFFGRLLFDQAPSVLVSPELTGAIDNDTP